MRLYHLTDEVHWGLIALRGELIPRMLKEEKYGRIASGASGLPGGIVEVMYPRQSEWDVVLDGHLWLTTNANPKQLWMRTEGQSDPWAKGGVRIEVDFPEAKPWLRVIKETGFPKRYADALADCGGNPREWYVTEEPIPSERWITVVRTRDGAVLHRSED